MTRRGIAPERRRRGLAASVVALALVAVAGPTAMPSPAGAEPAAPEPAAAPEAPALSEVDALAQAGKLKAPVEVTSLRNEHSRVLATPRGTLVLETYAEPQWTKGRDGGPWRKIDTRLERRADGSVAPVATLTDVSFTAGGSGPTIRLPLAEGQVSLSWPADLPAPTLDGDTAVYASVLPDVDLRLRALRDGFTWALVVRSAQAAANPALDELRFALRTTGSLTKRSRSGGGFEVADGNGRSVLSAGGALMWDSAGVATGATGRAAAAFAAQDRRDALRVVPDRARKAEIPTGVQGEDLVIRPDRSLLRGKSTVYPVVIDPWSTIEKTRWGYSSTNDATRNDGVARVGKDPEGSGTYRSYFSFKLTSLSGKTIRDAKFLTEMTHSWDCGNTPVNLWRTADMATTGKQAWSGPSFSKWLEERSAHAHKPSGGAGCSDDPQPDKPMEFASQNVIDDISANRGQDIYTLALSIRQSDGTSESTSNWWKKFDPVQTKLTIEYNTNPNTPTAAQLTTHAGYTAPAQPCVTGTSRPAVRSDFPWLKATVSDPDGSGGGSLAGVFTLQKLVGSTWTNVSGWPKTDSGVAPGAKAELQLTTKTVNGELYRWQVQTRDTLGGVSASASPWCEFSIDYSAPASTPTVTAADGLYPEAPPRGTDLDSHGSPGYSGRFTFSANGAADVYDYVYQVNGGPEMTVRASQLGGPATVWITPTVRLENVVTVRSRDQAGNPSATYDYVFYAGDPSAPVAHWAMDEGTGTTLANKIDGGAAATLTPTPKWADSRVLGTHKQSGKDWAVELDGVDDQAATAGAVIDTTRSFSFAAWVRADAVGGVVVAQVGANKSPFELQYYPTKQRWCFVSYASDTAYAASTPSPACATDPVQPGVWVHLTGVYDAGASSQLALYVNGVRKGTGATSAAPWSATGPLLIGAGRNGAPTGWVKGAISEVRVWNRAIDPDIDLVGLVRPVRVGQWEMEDDDQEEPRQAGDSSGYQHPLSLTASPSAQWTSDGFDSMGLTFNGSGGAVSDGPVLRTDQSYTVSAWVRFTGGTGARTVIAQDGTNISSSFLSCRTDANGSRWSVMVRSGDSTAASGFYVYGSNCVVNQWAHLSAVQDVTTKTISLYVNGLLVSQSTPTFAPWHGAGGLSVGRGKWGAPTDYFNGDIDRVQVWQGALSAAEVQAVAAGF